MNSGPRWIAVTLVIGAILALTGCDMSDDSPRPSSQDDTAKALSTMLALPTREDSEAQLTSVVEQIGVDAAAVVPGMTWAWHDDRMTSGCTQFPPYDQTDGSMVELPEYATNVVTVSEQAWSHILEIARTAAAKLGATSKGSFQDAPGNHDVQFTNDTGTLIEIGYKDAVAIRSRTGCRLTQAQKNQLQRASSVPPTQ